MSAEPPTPPTSADAEVPVDLPARPAPLGADSAPEPPPKGVKAMAVVRWILLALSFAVAVGSWYSYAFAQQNVASVTYQCPMHPEVVSDQPGECPICHMSLERVAGDRLDGPPAASARPAASPHPAASAGAAHPPPAKPGQYTCPMHPEVVSATPGSCPKCNMDLVPAEANPPEARMPDGTVEVALSLDRVQAIGVRTARVVEGSTASAVRAPAIVEAPEETTAQVHVRAAGFVEGIAVGQTGVRVKSGQLLLSVYSPEIYQAQAELLATQRWPVLGEPAQARDAGARRKLELLGVSSKVADRVLVENKPFRTTGVSAPIAGFVTKKNVVLGSFVTPEMALYEIVDLSKVYVVADLYQGDASAVKVGTEGVFRSNRHPEPVAATVDLVYPQMNVQSRTVRVRMTLKNDALTLVPGDYGLVEFGVTAGRSVIVPTDAVIDTGRAQYVFVEVSPGTYAPRTVEIVGEVEQGFEVRAGLTPGETVVSGATFLIDSESRLRASLSRSTSSTPSPAGQPPAAPSGHQH